MNKYSPEIATLRMDIEQSVKRKIRTPYDFEFLAGVIWDTRTDIESAAFEGEGVHINDLQKGDRVEVTWLPNRRCVFRYEGDAHFTVIEAENTKLQVGDSFDAACFIIGKPMYLDKLQGNEVPSTREGLYYVAGSKNGLNTVEIVRN